MYFLKSDINQFEHLIVLLSFITIIFIVSEKEASITAFQKYIDYCIGFDDINTNNVTFHLQIPAYKDLKRVLETIIQWIIKDYKSSQCRKWIKWIKNKRVIIFSS